MLLFGFGCGTEPPPSAEVVSPLRVVAWLDLEEDERAVRGSNTQWTFLQKVMVEHPEVPLEIVPVTSLEGDALAERLAEWEIDVPLVSSGGRRHKRFPVTQFLDADRKELYRWEGYVSSSQLSLTLQAFKADPLPCDIPPPAAPFTAVGLTREVENGLWMIDDGSPWISGQPHTTRWLALSDDVLHIDGVGDVEWKSLSGLELRAMGARRPVWVAVAEMTLQGASCTGLTVKWGDQTGTVSIALTTESHME